MSKSRIVASSANIMQILSVGSWKVIAAAGTVRRPKWCRAISSPATNSSPAIVPPLAHSIFTSTMACISTICVRAEASENHSRKLRRRKPHLRERAHLWRSEIKATLLSTTRSNACGHKRKKRNDNRSGRTREHRGAADVRTVRTEKKKMVEARSISRARTGGGDIIIKALQISARS